MKSLVVVLGFVVPVMMSSQMCVDDLQETICKDFEFGPETVELRPTANILVLEDVSGKISKKHLENLANVTEITITTSKIDGVDSGALCAPPKLASLNLLFNDRFPKISPDLLKGCANLKKINVDGAELLNGAFAEAANLETATLNDTKFSGAVGEDTFRGLPALKSLTIRHSRFEGGVENGAFGGLSALKFLDLQSNGIRTLPDGVFKNLTGLKVLDLSENQLETLEFSGLTGLKVLFLDRNRIREFAWVDGLLKNVMELDRVFLSGRNVSAAIKDGLDKKFGERNVSLIYVDNEEIAKE